MKQAHHTLAIPCRGSGFNDLTRQIRRWVRSTGILSGLLNMYLQETSCSLSIQENADPDIDQDMQVIVAHQASNSTADAQAVEESGNIHGYTRMAITNVSLTIPVQNGRPILGTWQGIYLYEHRHHASKRNIFVHLIGD